MSSRFLCLLYYLSSRFLCLALSYPPFLSFETALLALDDGAAAATKTISKHNVRVDMSLEYGGSDSDGEEDEEGADEVPDRDRVKVSANELAEKLAKRKKGGRGGTPLDGQGSKGSRPSMA